MEPITRYSEYLGANTSMNTLSRASKDGEWVKYKDVEKLLNTRKDGAKEVVFQCNNCPDTENAYAPCRFITPEYMGENPPATACPISSEDCEWEKEPKAPTTNKENT